MMGRKFYLALIYEGTLLIVLAAVILAGKLDALLFGAWLAAYTAGFVTYVMGNVAVANAPVATITTSKKTETKSAESITGVPG
jgi:hypothetical protein